MNVQDRSGASTEARLSQIRGGVEPKRLDARGIAALTANPGCVRRAIVDAAGVDKDRLARHIGFPMPFGQSSFAIGRAKAFAAQVKADGCAQLLALLREVLHLSLPEVAYHDLERVGDNPHDGLRHAKTRRLLTESRTAPDQGTLFDHPLLRLTVGGRPIFLEPDLIALQFKGRFYVVGIKSFAIIDGQADGGKVAAAAMQSAVYVHALQALLAGTDGLVPAVADEVVLVCPKDFSNRPAAAFIDVRRQLAILRRQLSRMASIDALLSLLPPELCLSPARPRGEVIGDLRQLEARYMPECLNSCALARFCREDARGHTRALGRSVAEELGGIEQVTAVLDLARGTLPPSPDQEDAAARLRSAWTLRTQCLAEAGAGAA